MELLTIPFEGQFLVYRPLRPLAFVANASMASYVEGRAAGRCEPRGGEIDEFLANIDFWAPDSPAPTDWQPPAEHRPHTAVLLMTSACNLRCTYCYAHGGEGPLRQMTTPLARTAIDAAHENAERDGADSFQLVFHGGGEPTANWSVLRDAVLWARGKPLDCQITMSTNGVLSSSRRRFIIEHFDGVSLSFDGIREVQNAQRPTAGGRGSFDAVLETIRAFDAAGLAYGTRLTVTPEHFETIPASVELLCEESQCQSLQVEPAYSAARGEHIEPSREESDAFVRSFLEAFEVSMRYRRTLYYSGARPWSVTSSFCSAARDALIVTPTGKLVTCFEIYDDSHPEAEHFRVGEIDVAAEKPDEGFLPLPVLGQSAASMSTVRIDDAALRSYASEEASHRAECEGCFAYWHCAGDCATRRTASRTALHGRCHVNREITREVLAWYVAEGGGVWLGGESRVRASETADTDRVSLPSGI